MKKTILFDLDGTLSDTAIDLIGAVNIFLQQKSLSPLAFDMARNTAGKGGTALIKLGYKQAGFNQQGILETDIIEYLKIYNEEILKNPTLFYFVREALDHFRRDKWVMGICTNKPQQLATKLLNVLGIEDYFDAVVGGDFLPVRKPSPEHIFETVGQLNGSLERTVLIGDTQTDSNAAKNAGIDCILFSGGYAQEPVHTYKPKAVFDSFNELPALFKDKYTHWG